MDIRHPGNWPKLGILLDEDDLPIELYECPLCWALTREPGSHAEWHINQRTEHYR